MRGDEAGGIGEAYGGEGLGDEKGYAGEEDVAEVHFDWLVGRLVGL